MASRHTGVTPLPHWNWEPGQTVDMWAYYNNADEVELYLNGESQGVRSLEPGKYHVSWRLPFEPGTLRAVSRKDGRMVAEKSYAQPASLTPYASPPTAP